MLVLQIVVQAQAFAGEVFADDGHGEVGAVLAAPAFGGGETQMAGFVGDFGSLVQQVFPFRSGQAAVFEVGARPFAAVIEEADIVVRVFKRFDVGFDKAVELDQVFGQSSR